MLRSAYQRSVAAYWNNERDPVNIRLGEVDGFYHHHYGVGDYDPSVLEAPGRRPGRRPSSPRCTGWRRAQADLLLDHFGDVGPGDRLLDGGSGRGGTSFMANQRFGCQVDGVSISEAQVEFANEQARQRGVADQVRFHFRNMLDTGFETGSRQVIWTNETTMYVDLHELFGEFARLLRYGGRYVCITGCYNDVTGGRSKAVSQIDQHYTCNIHPRSEYFQALAANGFVPINVIDLTAAHHPVLGAAGPVLGRHRRRGPVPHRLPRGQLPLPAHRRRLRRPVTVETMAPGVVTGAGAARPPAGGLADC